MTIEAHHLNITTQEGYSQLKSKLLTGGLNQERVNLVLSCVDNYAARMTLNTLCTQENQIWIESGVSEDAMVKI